MKYVIVDRVLPVIFSQGIEHDRMKHLGKIESAGFCDISPDPDDKYEVKVSCYGDSFSLGIKSNPEKDAQIISININNF